MKNYNDVDLEMLAHISDFTLENGYQPTIRQLCKITGYSSTSTVYNSLKRLEAAGEIEMLGKKMRLIRILNEDFALVMIRARDLRSLRERVEGLECSR